MTRHIHEAGRSVAAIGLALLTLLAPRTIGSPTAGQEEVARYRSTIHGLDSPSAVAVGPDDRIWVADSGHDRVRSFTLGEDRATEGPGLGERGSAPGQFLDPRGVCVAADGSIYVADTGNHRIQAFDATGTFRFAIGALGSGPGEFHTPLGLAANEDFLLVCDAGNRRVQMFSLAGELKGELSPVEPLERPVDVAFHPDGRIVVGDQGAYRCILFDAHGDELARFGDVGWFPGLFSRIGGVDVHRDRIYVADAENHRVQEFSIDGTLAAKWGLHAIRPREGRGKVHYPSHLAVAPSGLFSVLAEPFDDRVQIFGRGEEVVEGGDVFRQINTQPSPHYGFRTSASHHWLIIVEPETQELLVFDTQIDPPRLVSRIGGYGTRMGQFHGPAGIHLDGDSREVLVTERASRRLQSLVLRVDPDAEVAFDREMASFVRMLDFDSLGRTVAGVKLEWTIEPTAVTRDAGGRVFVLDALNERVHVFSPELRPLYSFGGHGSSAGQLSGPTDLALGPAGTRLFVVDAFNRRVQVFSADGDPLFSFDGAPGERLERPYGIAITKDGKVFVTDTGTHRMLSFAADGKPTGALGGEGIQRAQFYKPRGVTIDGRGRVIVIDHGNHRAQVFSQGGEYLDSFGARLYTRPARLPHTFDPADYLE